MMNWISIEDNLPILTKTSNGAHSSEPVLAITRQGYVGRCVFERDVNSDRTWWFELDVDEVSEVVGWMPCPGLLPGAEI